MLLKKKMLSPRDNIHVGMVFFLVGVFVSQMADGRLVGGFFASLLPDGFSTNAVQGFSAGFSIPIFCASIYFNLRGLMMVRLR